LRFRVIRKGQVERRPRSQLATGGRDHILAPRIAPALLDLGREFGRIDCRQPTAKQRAKYAMNQSPWTAIHEGERRRDNGVVGRAESDLLRESQAEHRAGLAVVCEAVAGGAVDQVVEVGNAPQRLTGDGDREAMIGGRELTLVSGSGIQRLSTPKNAVEHLQRSLASAKTLNAWHRAIQSSS
jgi:hypothetical protein